MPLKEGPNFVKKRNPAIGKIKEDTNEDFICSTAVGRLGDMGNA